MSLKDLVLRNQYRSDRHNLLQDFYIPCLSRSLTYDRAVGFFSSSSLALAAQGLTAFVHSGGNMRLVASPQLSEEGHQEERRKMIASLLRVRFGNLDELLFGTIDRLLALPSEKLMPLLLQVSRDELIQHTVLPDDHPSA